jgi:beta-glucosidase
VHRPLEFGVATSAYQTEGAVGRDGRGESIWDTFCRRSGAIADGSDGSMACQSYDLVNEDVSLAQRLGAGWYRFSIAWPRVIPDGTGRIEQRGLDYYDRLVDHLLDAGIAPAPTLYHWDLPQILEDHGGWLSRDTASAFAEYATVVAERLTDRVPMWATLNEPWCSAYLGYAAGVHAPGRMIGKDAHRATHHLMLAHGWGAQALRAAGAGWVGIVLNPAPILAATDVPQETTDAVDALRNRVWWGPIVNGRYDDQSIAAAPVLADPDLVRDGDLHSIHGSAQWLGINYYTPMRLVRRTDHKRAAGGEEGAYPGVAGFQFAPREPQTSLGWEIHADSLRDLLVDLSHHTHLPLIVTENGAAFRDSANSSSSASAINDADRIRYLRDHLEAVHAAREVGADVRAYFAWTLLDNFEWAHGYTQKFGIVQVDAVTGARTPKASFYWLADYFRAGYEKPR